MTETGDQRTAFGAPATIAVLSRDLFFGMRIRTTVSRLGYRVLISQQPEDLLAHVREHPDAIALVLVDFNQPIGWAALAPLQSMHLPVVAFGSHTDVEGFRAAKAAGVARVISNGEFSRSLPDLVARYARR